MKIWFFVVVLLFVSSLTIAHGEMVDRFGLPEEPGDSSAQRLLGRKLLYGKDASKALKQKGLKHILNAAEQGNIYAQGNLVMIYHDGKVVKKDYVLSYMWDLIWIQKAGDIRGYSKGDAAFISRLLERMTPNQIQRAEELARNWRPRIKNLPEPVKNSVSTDPVAIQRKTVYGVDHLQKIINAHPWVVYKTDKIHLYCLPDSEAEREQELILKERTRALKKIEAFFGKAAPQPIKVFLIPTRKEFPVGTAWPANFACSNLYQSGKWSFEKHNFGHEPTHIFSNMDERFKEQTYPIGLLDEGIAEYLSGYSLDPHLRLTHHLQAHGTNYTQIKIIPYNLHYGTQMHYQISASFVKHLIEDYQNGQKKFLSLLKRTNRRIKNEKPDFNKFVTSMEDVYGKSFSTIMDNWNNVLKPYWQKTMPLPSDDLKKIKAALSDSGNGKLLEVFYDAFGLYLEVGATTSKGKTRFLRATPENTWTIVH